MGYMNSLVATAILCFGASTLAVPAPAQDWATLPLFYGPAPRSSAAAPQHVTYTPEQLQAFLATEAAPFNVSGDANEALSARGIIGDDNRVLWNNQDYPYSAMGRLQNSNGGLCSGTLIGPRHVATAKHCVPGAGISARFAPQYYDGERAGGSQVATVITVASGDGSCGQKEDWAIYILADRLGDRFGYLGAKVINCDAQKNRAMFFHLGYPGDHGASRPYRQEGISVSRCADCEPGGPLETDADAVPGQSGGPLWLLEDGSRYQYGVLSGTSSIGSGFAAGGNFVNTVIAARNDFP